MTDQAAAQRTTPTRYGTLGQWLWLVGGGWTGFWTDALIEANRKALPRLVADFLLVPAMIGSPVVFALCTAAFPLWHAARAGRMARPTTLAWWGPFLVGLPLVCGMAWLYDLWLAQFGFSRATSFAAFAVLVPIGLPVIAAEACLRLSSRRETPAT